MAKSKSSMPTDDNPAKELLDIVSKSITTYFFEGKSYDTVDKTQLMEKLTMFVSYREMIVGDHWYKIGLKNVKKK
jgi:hypothetical protein